MNISETDNATETQAPGLKTLTNLMALSSDMAARAEQMHNSANQLAEEVGVLAERYGYSMDQVMTPLWKTPVEV